MLRAELSEYTFNALVKILNIDGEGLPYERNYAELPAMLYEYTGRITELALHEDYRELILNEPIIGGLVAKEFGGSAAMWICDLHTVFCHKNDDRYEKLERLFKLSPRLLTEMRDLRVKLLGKAFLINRP